MKRSFPSILGLLTTTMAMTFAISMTGLWPAFAAEGEVSLVTRVAPEFVGLRGDTSGGGGGIVSGDGRFVVFASASQSLVTNRLLVGTTDVFLKDRQTGGVRLVSVSVSGDTGADGNAEPTAISDDGRYVLFESRAGNLATNLIRSIENIFIRDMVEGVTQMVSASADGLSSGNQASGGSSMTPDGRIIVFESDATNLVAQDVNGLTDVFARDRITRVTTLVSKRDPKATGVAASATGSRNAQIASDGRHVVFESDWDFLRAGDTKHLSDVFVADLGTGTLTLASVSLSGAPGTGPSVAGALSADGRYVTFLSAASDLVTLPGSAGLYCLFQRDLQTGTTVRITAPALRLDSASPDFDMTEDGGKVAYVAGGQVYLWDALTQATAPVTLPTNGLSVGSFESVSFVRNGGRLFFTGVSDGLVPQPTYGVFQIYGYDLASGAVSLISATSDGARGSRADCLPPSVSVDGNVVVWESADAGMVPGDVNRAEDVFARSLPSGEVELVSVSSDPAACLTPNASSTLTGVSAERSRIVFVSSASDLVTNDANQTFDVFLRDPSSLGARLVTVSWDGTGPGDRGGNRPAMSPDGRFVAFFSTSTNLVPDDTNRLEDIFLRDTLLGVTRLLATRPASAPTATLNDAPLFVSPDGGHVAFSLATGTRLPRIWDASTGVASEIPAAGVRTTPTSATAAVLAQLDNGDLVHWYGTNVYRCRLGLSTNELLGGSTALPVVSANGRFVFLQAIAKTTNLVQRVDLVTGAKLTVAAGTTQTDLSVSHTRMTASADGGRLGFVDSSASLAVGAPAGFGQVLVADVADSGVSLRVASVNPAGVAGNKSSYLPSMSADGRFLAFSSEATDLGFADANGQPDIFVRDLTFNRTYLANHTASGGSASLRGQTPMIAPSGAFVLFSSAAGDLVAQDFNETIDLFSYSIPRMTTEDSDLDGLPDAWERQYFGDLAQNGSADADGDGYPNLAEFRAGMNPTAPDAPLVVRIQPGASGQVVDLSWRAPVLGRFVVEFRDDLGGGNENGGWTPSGSVVVGGADGLWHAQEPRVGGAGESAQRFYRLRWQQP